MFANKKTYITGTLAILGAIGGYFTHDLALADAIQIAIPALMGMFIRNGIANK